jgi:hypothetical protein
MDDGKAATDQQYPYVIGKNCPKNAAFFENRNAAPAVLGSKMRFIPRFLMNLPQ